jgi:hypothetical protein
MRDEGIELSSICSATNWWAENYFANGKKILRRLPIAAWALTKDCGFKAVCFDESSGRFFYAESDDEFEVSYKYGSELKQIGDGIPFDDEKPKRTNRKSKK